MVRMLGEHHVRGEVEMRFRARTVHHSRGGWLVGWRRDTAWQGCRQRRVAERVEGGFWGRPGVILLTALAASYLISPVQRPGLPEESALGYISIELFTEGVNSHFRRSGKLPFYQVSD